MSTESTASEITLLAVGNIVQTDITSKLNTADSPTRQPTNTVEQSNSDVCAVSSLNTAGILPSYRLPITEPLCNDDCRRAVRTQHYQDQ